MKKISRVENYFIGLFHTRIIRSHGVYIACVYSVCINICASHAKWPMNKVKLMFTSSQEVHGLFIQRSCEHAQNKKRANRNSLPFPIHPSSPDISVTNLTKV